MENASKLMVNPPRLGLLGPCWANISLASRDKWPGFKSNGQNAAKNLSTELCLGGQGQD